uniref:Treslin n=1 Tax=Varanus komodoensis TaxID=61221 RepID=A0A8D2Q8W0_VARKO
MTCSHNVVFLLDTASSVQKLHLHLGTLRILNYLGCRFGLAKVRWGFKFFDSLGGQGRASRVGSLRELGSRSWEEFEEELETRFRSRCCSPHLPGSVSQAAFTGNILKETLLDYQWDRPEIASPAKPILRNQKSKFVVTLDKPPASSIPEGFVNAIFLFSPCPHSQRELLHFISESHVYLSDVLPSVHDLTEKIVPKGIQEMMANQKITLYWVDTTEKVKFLASPDHIGYWMLVELMQLLGGTILPSETLIQYLHHYRTGTAPFSPVEPMSSELPFGPWTTILPFNSTLDYLLSLPSRLQTTFLPQEGVLFFQTDEESQACAVLLEPLTVNQKCFTSPANIYLKNTMTGWDSVHAGNFYTESWVLRSPPAGLMAQDSLSFQQFVKYILAQGLHMVAEVSPSGSCSPCTGILSPISDTAAVLSLLWAERTAEVERTLFQTPVEKNLSKDDSFSLPEIVSSVLNQVVGDSEGCLTSAEPLFPEWAQQELSHTYHWNPAVTEGWYSFSNLCGASSQLMESLLEANPAIGEEEASEPEGELMRCLSEFYQRKTSDLSTRSHQQDHRKRCGVPRTPVRQKMKTMSRSLQMLNVARLNVKAQKFLPDDKPSVSKKVSQRLQSRRSDHKLEERVETMRTRIGMCFRTEEEMLSYITANYQKAVIDGENVSTYAQDMMTAVYTFQKANEVRQIGTPVFAACRAFPLVFYSLDALTCYFHQP